VLYKGDRSIAEETARTAAGRTRYVMYHRINDSIAVNDHLFEGGKIIDKKFHYMPISEIEVLIDVAQKLIRVSLETSRK